MRDSRGTLVRVARTAGYLLLGVLGTAAVTIALARVTVPVQRIVYRALYLQLGPSEATETATLVHILGVGTVAIAVPTLVADYLRSDLDNGRPVLLALSILLGVLLVFLLVTLVGYAATPIAILLLVVAVVAIPVLLRYRFDVRSGAVTAFAGGVPVLFLLVLLAGVGLGWGWGYTVTAQEVPESTVGDAEVGSLSDAPAVEEALFTASDCETDADGFRVCYLHLRGFEHERAAARALADLGVRCPYQGTGGDGGSAFVRYGGDYYEVSCSPHGD